jgi:folate-binding protein YgfZ
MTQNITYYKAFGPDTKDFFQRITTVNFKTLKPGAQTLGFFLSPLGKIISFFEVACITPNEYLFFLDGQNKTWQSTFLETIEFYKFSEKFEICTLETTALHPQYLRSFSTEVERLSALWPKVGQEITALTNPLELGLRSAISENKGCYPGQEVIERIWAIGAPAQRLCLLEFDPLSPSADLPSMTLSPEVGTLTSVVPGQGIALALVKKNYAKTDQELALHPGDRKAKIIKVSQYEI